MSHVVTFSIEAVAASSDDALLLAQAAALGPSLALVEPPWWIAVALCAAKDAPAMRIAVGGDQDAVKALIKGPADQLHGVLRAHVAGLRAIETDALLDESHWLTDIARRHSVSLLGHLLPLTPHGAALNELWTSRFLDHVRRLGTDKSPAGVVVILRPTSRGGQGFLDTLRRYFLDTPLSTVTTTLGKTTGKKDSPDSKNEQSTTHVVDTAQQARERGIHVLDELMRSGAWWIGIHAFGPNETKARSAAALAWACMSNVGRGGHRPDPQGTTRPIGTILWRPEASGATAPWFDPLTRSPGTADSAAGAAGLLPHLHEAGVKWSFAGASDLTPLVSNPADPMWRTLVLPQRTDMLVSGERLTAAVQLPIAPGPAVTVVRGFDYCRTPRRRAGQGTVRLGAYCDGGLQPTESEAAGSLEPVLVDLDDLTKHVLVVGATGSGKTTTVVHLLRSLRQQRSEGGDPIRVAVLEGAKREYRGYLHDIGITVRGHFDLRGAKGFLSLNLFEHPPTVSPESHLGQLGAIFEATLEMPSPVPTVMREALARAYDHWHRTPASSDLRKLHPVRFWLLRAIFQVLEDADYQGEVQANVKGALRTRIASLSAGAAGTVLSGSASWDELRSQLAEQSILLELESVADKHSRALVMSLFVLYYRYALEGRKGKGLRFVLVLEEAHRIIGRTPGRENSDASLEFFSNLLGEIRAHGCGLIISDQSPSRLIDDAMRNTNTKLLMRLVAGEDIDVAVRGAGLPEEARADIPQLAMGQAVFVSPGRLPGLIQLPAPPPRADAAVEGDVVDIASLRASLSADLTETRAFFQLLSSPPQDSPSIARDALERAGESRDAVEDLLLAAYQAAGCNHGWVAAGSAACPQHAESFRDHLLLAVSARLRNRGPSQKRPR